MIYLDHAATSHPKPPGVLAAVQRWYLELGVGADRGDGTQSRIVAREVAAVRHRLARMCGVPDRRLAFTSGATESLNAFLAGYLRPGDAVLTTALEHSSMVRPLTHLAQRRGLELTVLDPDPSGRIDAARAAEALARGGFRLFAFTHASNVTGAVLDAAGLCAVARAAGVATLLDASQTAGLLSIDVGATALAASAHKGLLGPPGLGVLAVAPELDLPPVRFGGTGSAAALDRQPDEWPGAMEPGTPNTPAILGLGAALEWLDAQNPGALDRGLELIDLLRAELAPEAECFGPHDGARIPVCSFRWPGLDPAECGLLLDAAGIHVRTGMHCAPWLHRHLGTEAGGTVRVSVGPFSRADDVREVPRALRGG